MKNERKYSLFSNIVYALGNIWRWDRAFYLYFIPKIPLSIVIDLATIYIPKLIIDLTQQDKLVGEITIIIVVYFLVLFILNLIQSFCGNRLNYRRYNVSSMYQMKIADKYLRTDFSNTSDPDFNLKYSHAMNDACSGQCAPEFIWISLDEFLKNSLGIITYGTIIAALSPIILIMLIISSIITYITSRWQLNYTEKNKDKWATIDRKIGYLSGFSSKFEYAKDIRIYNMIIWLNSLLENFQKERFDWTKKVNNRAFIKKCINALLTFIREGTAYTVLIIMFLKGNIGVSDFVFLLAAINGLSDWLYNIIQNFNNIISQSIKIGYYREYFDIKDYYNHGVGCSLPEMGFPIEIEFKNVSYKYPKADGYALKNINFKIKPHEKIAIVGANGAGKTTLVKLMCGLYYPTEGVINVNGKNIKDYNIEEYYTLFSPVFQDIYLLPVPIWEFVASSDNDIIKEPDKVRIKMCLEKAGLGKKIAQLKDGIDSRLMKGVFDDSIDLSGGEKQKLMLARALYKDASVIVLDEPTAALDPIAENELYMKYNDLTKDKTSVYISHRLASTRFCDRIFFLENGEIIEIGSHNELMKLNGKYTHMFNLQSHYYKEDVNHA